MENMLRELTRYSHLFAHRGWLNTWDRALDRTWDGSSNAHFVACMAAS